MILTPLRGDTEDFGGDAAVIAGEPAGAWDAVSRLAWVPWEEHAGRHGVGPARAAELLQQAAGLLHRVFAAAHSVLAASCGRIRGRHATTASTGYSLWREPSFAIAHATEATAGGDVLAESIAWMRP